MKKYYIPFISGILIACTGFLGAMTGKYGRCAEPIGFFAKVGFYLWLLPGIIVLKLFGFQNIKSEIINIILMSISTIIIWTVISYICITIFLIIKKRMKSNEDVSVNSDTAAAESE